MHYRTVRGGHGDLNSLKPIKINDGELKQNWIIKFRHRAYKVSKVTAYGAFIVPFNSTLTAKRFHSKEEELEYHSRMAETYHISLKSECPIYGKHVATYTKVKT